MSTTPFPLPIMLDAADRKALRARAHHLDPVIMIGEAGLTRAVLDETDRALRTHELIKVRVLGDDREQRQTMSTEICSALGCTAVQSIGKLLVLYRPRPIEDPRDEPHVPKKRAAQGLGRAKGSSVKTGKATKRVANGGAAKGGAAKGGAAKGGRTSARNATKRATSGKPATTREAGARTAAKRSAEERGARPSRMGGAKAGSGARAVGQRSTGGRPAAKRTGRTAAVSKTAGAPGKQSARSAGRTNARATGRTDAPPAGRTSARSAGSTSTRQTGRTKKS